MELFVWVYGISTIVSYLKPNPFLDKSAVLFQIIQFCVSRVSISRTVLFQEMQFSLSTQFSSIWPIRCYNSGQSGPESDGNKNVLRIPQGWAVSSLSDSLLSYLGNLLGESYPSAGVQTVYSTAPADWATRALVRGVLLLCREAVGVFYSTSRLGHRTLVGGVLPHRSEAVGLFYSPSRVGHQDTRWWSSNTSFQRCRNTAR